MTPWLRIIDLKVEGGGKSQDVQTKWEENKTGEIKSDGEKSINYQVQGNTLKL